MARSRVHEGDWFVVPLRDGRFAAGLAARVSSSGILFGYFFGPAQVEPPLKEDVVALKPDEAVLVGQFGHLGLSNGTWRLLGSLPHWDRAQWPAGPLIRYEELTGRTYRVFYDDLDPSVIVSEERVPPGPAEQGPPDGLMGAGYVERVLTKALAD